MVRKLAPFNNNNNKDCKQMTNQIDTPQTSDILAEDSKKMDKKKVWALKDQVI